MMHCTMQILNLHQTQFLMAHANISIYIFRVRIIGKSYWEQIYSKFKSTKNTSLMTISKRSELKKCIFLLSGGSNTILQREHKSFLPLKWYFSIYLFLLGYPMRALYSTYIQTGAQPTAFVSYLCRTISWLQQL